MCDGELPGVRSDENSENTVGTEATTIFPFTGADFEHCNTKKFQQQAPSGSGKSGKSNNNNNRAKHLLSSTDTGAS